MRRCRRSSARKSRFTTEQIIKVLHAWEAGAKPRELSRQHGITETTLYRWKR
jgi:putative transposase